MKQEHPDLFRRVDDAPPDIRREADIGGPNDEFRWTLRRSWGEGAHVLFCMLNPSDADHERDDPTMHAVMHFARLWGFPGVTVVNPWPFRSSSPAACQRWAFGKGPGDPDVARVLEENLRVIEREANAAARIVVAWGNGAWDAGWIARVERVLRTVGNDLFCLGTTDSGAPKHPLARGVHRVPRDQQPIVWRRA
jgi:hypothetical protein